MPFTLQLAGILICYMLEKSRLLPACELLILLINMHLFLEEIAPPYIILCYYIYMCIYHYACVLYYCLFIYIYVTYPILFFTKVLLSITYNTFSNGSYLQLTHILLMYSLYM